MIVSRAWCVLQHSVESMMDWQKGTLGPRLRKLEHRSTAAQQVQQPATKPLYPRQPKITHNSGDLRMAHHCQNPYVNTIAQHCMDPELASGWFVARARACVCVRCRTDARGAVRAGRGQAKGHACGVRVALTPRDGQLHA